MSFKGAGGHDARTSRSQMQINGCDITRSAIAKIEVGQRHLYPDEIVLLKKILGATYDEIFMLKNLP